MGDNDIWNADDMIVSSDDEDGGAPLPIEQYHNWSWSGGTGTATDDGHVFAADDRDIIIRS